MKRLLLIAAISGTAALCACSSGGGQDGGRNVAGIWIGAITKLSDTCGAASNAPQTINFSHNVGQNDNTVTLLDENGNSYVGETLSDDGFSVDGTAKAPATCSDLSVLSYQNIDEDNDPTATLDITINRTCTNGASCRIEYSGTAARNTGVGPTPTPTATPGATPVASGGCLDINPNPAADSYAGDGECGISSAVYRISGQTVVLEPFGANGATSFAVNPANTSSAASNNLDLTIKGEAGYACSMACSPPGTFSVTCFKEGGTTCIEKF